MTIYLVLSAFTSRRVSLLANDKIYLLNAIRLPPDGSSTVHIYTQTIHRTTQNKQYREKNKKFCKSAGRAQSLQVIPWHLSYNWVKGTEKLQSG